ncbi:MAG: hypothetical protein EZS28_007506 [Streblomastix strix]|uniref:Uncharacterized protein n=1 Tax=Streblomastix strix TaxID=222440 RepID=A0A5J4WQW7_9EUKA|nr:MAG: hypothetical protein EZS28_007506 [Streblomastix strix]
MEQSTKLSTESSTETPKQVRPIKYQTQEQAKSVYDDYGELHASDANNPSQNIDSIYEKQNNMALKITFDFGVVYKEQNYEKLGGQSTISYNYIWPEEARTKKLIPKSIITEQDLDEYKDITQAVAQRNQLTFICKAIEVQQQQLQDYKGQDIDSEIDNILEFSVLIAQSAENETPAFYISNKETLTGLRFCPFCKSRAFDPLHSQFERDFEKHIKKCEIDEGKIIKENKTYKFLLANGGENEFKPTQYYITYDFETVEKVINKDFGKSSKQISQLIPLSVVSTIKNKQDPRLTCRNRWTDQGRKEERREGRDLGIREIDNDSGEILDGNVSTNSEILAIMGNNQHERFHTISIYAPIERQPEYQQATTLVKDNEIQGYRRGSERLQDNV